MPRAYPFDECEVFTTLIMLILIFSHFIINKKETVFLYNPSLGDSFFFLILFRIAHWL